MLCPKCNREIGSAKFCPYCGSAAAENAAPNVETVDPSFYGEPTPPAPVKKKKVWPWVLGVIAALIAAFAVVVVLNLSYFGNLWRKTFYSPEKYYRHVEQEAIEESLDRVNASAKERKDAVPLSGSSRLKADLKLGKEAEALLKGLPVDLSWLKNLGTELKVNQDESGTETVLSFTLNGADVLDLRLLVQKNGEIYLTVPALSDQSASLSELIRSAAPEAKLPAVDPDALKDSLSDREALISLLKRYARIALEAVGEAEKSSETLTAGELSANFTVLTVKITPEVLKKAGKEILTALKEDEEALAILKKAAASAGEEKTTDEIKEALEEALDSLEETEIDDPGLSMSVYVDAYGKICGRRISFQGGKNVFVFLTVKDADRTGRLLSANFASENEEEGAESSSLTFEGTSTKENGVSSGEYSLRAGKDEWLRVKLDDWEENACGTIEILPAEALLKQISGNSLLSTLLKNVSLKLDLKELENQKASLSARIGENELATFSFSAEEGESEAIQKVTDSVPLGEWASSIDKTKVTAWAMGVLTKAGIPLSALQGIFSSLLSLMPSQAQA